MKKNSSIYKSARQSAIYGLFEVFRLIKVFATAFIIPIVSLLRDSRVASKVYYVHLGMILLLIFIIFFAIVKYWRFTYYLSVDNEFIVEEGVFSRSKISIPFDRIQSVDFEQNLIHQIFGVVKLKIDTAGSKNEEASLRAIDINKAKLIKSVILSYSKDVTTVEESEEVEKVETEHTIFQLDTFSLVKVGLTKNVFSSLLLIIALGYQIIDNLNQVGFKDSVKNYIDGATNEIAKTDTIFIVIVLGIFIFISFIVNLIRAVITHFELRLERQNDSFVLSQGLFNRRISTAKESKIQTLSWNNNLFEGFLKMNELVIKHASASEATKKNSMIVLGVNKMHIQTVMTMLFGKHFSIPQEFSSVSRKLFYRLILLATLPLCLYFGLIYLKVLFYSNLSIFIFGFAVLTFHYYQKKKCFAIDNDFLYIKGGVFGYSQVILPLHTVNNVTLKSTPYQRQNNLATIKLYHGAGFESIPYIDFSTAQILADFILYKIEISKKVWM